MGKLRPREVVRPLNWRQSGAHSPGLPGVSVLSCEVGWVREQAESRGVAKGVKGKQRTGVEEAQDAEGTREEELSHLAPSGTGGSGWRSLDPGEVTAGEGSPNLVSQAQCVPLLAGGACRHWTAAGALGLHWGCSGSLAKGTLAS